MENHNEIIKDGEFIGFMPAVSTLSEKQELFLSEGLTIITKKNNLTPAGYA